jgi:ABC-type multidrug transport system permease subunit
LPSALRILAEVLPLAHPVRISRYLSVSVWSPVMLWDLCYILAFIAIFGILGIKLVRRRLID